MEGYIMVDCRNLFFFYGDDKVMFVEKMKLIYCILEENGFIILDYLKNVNVIVSVGDDVIFL